MNMKAVQDAYLYCIDMARAHYENFPVASRFVPGHLRQPIAAIYAFARSADDFADEGDLDDATRLEKLNDFVLNLDKLKSGHNVEHPIFIALGDAIDKHQLPIQLFYDLLTAFTMDVIKKRYDTFDDVMNYCRYSANPVGRLLLNLFNQATPENIERSDAICSALQVINFFQDISQDYEENNRIYLPLDEMAQYGIPEQMLSERKTDNTMLEFMDNQFSRIWDMMIDGAPLGQTLSGRIGLELRLTIAGGLRVLQKLKQQRHDVFMRPRLNKRDHLWMLYQASFGNVKSLHIDDLLTKHAG